VFSRNCAMGYSEFYTSEPDLARQRVSLMHIVLWARLILEHNPTSTVAPPKAHRFGSLTITRTQPVDPSGSTNV
jgi:hypothetical protein